LTTLNAAVVPAMPSPSVRTETVVKPGVRARRRSVGRIAERKAMKCGLEGVTQIT